MTKTKKTNNKSKKKAVLITVSIILVILLACGGAGTYYYLKEGKKIEELSTAQEAAFLDFSQTSSGENGEEINEGNSEEIKYGQEVSYNDLLSKLVDTSKLQENTNITLSVNDKQINPEETYKFEQLGTYTLKVKLEYQYTYSLINSLTKTIVNEKSTEILIEDKEAPTINGVADKEITVGDQINLQDGITATDNVDGEVEVKVEGEVDNNKAGEYQIKVTATDNAGNNAEASFKVNVKEKPVVTTTSPKISSNSSTSKGGSNGGAVASSGNHVQDILRLTNQYRAEVGQNALTLDSKLSAAAQKRATELVQNCSHTRPNGTSCFTVYDDYGIHAWNYGENIAWGQANGASAAQWWRNSPGHYANMIRSGFHKIGIGVHSAGGRLYYVQLFADSV